MKRYLSANEYFKQTFGEKVYRISIDAGFTCPGRDGTLDGAGCIFCSAGGSGDFAGDKRLSIDEQILTGKTLIQNKIKTCHKFIAYYQAFTNTYAPVEILRERFLPAINNPEIVALSVATRPDCISDECLELLAELNNIKPVWIELGLQTIHESSAKFINRGYDLPVYDDAVLRLHTKGIETITHVILGIPGESEEMMLKTVEHVVKSKVKGIKLQILQVLKGTKLAEIYEKEPFHIMSLEEYGNLLLKALDLIPKDMVVHRITGDPPKSLLIEPKWTADKKRVLNYLKSI